MEISTSRWNSTLRWKISLQGGTRNSTHKPKVKFSAQNMENYTPRWNFTLRWKVPPKNSKISPQGGFSFQDGKFHPKVEISSTRWIYTPRWNFIPRCKIPPKVEFPKMENSITKRSFTLRIFIPKWKIPPQTRLFHPKVEFHTKVENSDLRWNSTPQWKISPKVKFHFKVKNFIQWWSSTQELTYCTLRWTFTLRWKIPFKVKFHSEKENSTQIWNFTSKWNFPLQKWKILPQFENSKWNSPPQGGILLWGVIPP